MKITGLIIIVWFCWPSAVSAQGIVSKTSGFEALKRLVGDQDYQFQLEVSPSQSQELRALLESKEVLEARPPDMLQSLGINFDEKALEDFVDQRAKTQNQDTIVAKHLANILTKEQIDAMRVLVLQKHLKFPLDAFKKQLLVNLGFSKSEVEAVRQRLHARPQEIQEELRALRRHAIGKVAGQFSEKSVKKFTQCFGIGYLQAPNRIYAVHESSIGVFAEDQGMYAFRKIDLLSPISPFVQNNTFRDIELTEDQLRQYQQVQRRITSNPRWKNPTFDPDQVANETIQSLLTTRQRTVITHFIHTQKLEADLRNLATARVREYLEIPAQETVQLSRLCAEWQDKIDARRLDLELELFQSTLAHLPARLRNIASGFYDDVWCDLR